MASAEETYVDPTALRRLYVHEPRSRAFCVWRGRVGGALPVTLHGRAELINSVSMALFRRDIDVSIAKAALQSFDDDLLAGRLAIADVPWRRVLERAAELSRAHTPSLGTRTLDVLHVASALVLGSKRFVTYDTRQAALARIVRLRVASP